MTKKPILLDIIHDNYIHQTNMTEKELRLWAKNPLSKKVSRNRKPIMMSIRLKSKPKKKWGMVEIRWAVKKAIPFLKRAKNRKGMKIRRKGLTKNQIILKNWGYDIKKKRRR